MKTHIKPTTTAPEGQNPESGHPKAVAVLRWKDYRGKRRKHLLRAGDTLFIGRDRISSLTVKSRYVSRRHALLTWWNGTFEIADLGSTNGTFVNGVAAYRPIKLKDGDLIHLGNVEFAYETL